MTDDVIELSSRHCETLRYGAAVVTEAESAAFSRSVPGWHRGFHEGVEKIKREFHFVGFSDAFAFTHKLAMLADREDHHPCIITEWGKVTVYWWSHKINGLHVNDYIMAAKTDLVAKLSAKS